MQNQHLLLQNLERIHSNPDFFDYEDTELDRKWSEFKQNPEAMKDLRNYARYGIKGTAEAAQIAAPWAASMYPSWAAQISMGANTLRQLADKLKYEELVNLQNLQAMSANNLGGIY